MQHESRKSFLERMEEEGCGDEMRERCRQLIAEGVKKADAATILDHEFGRCGVAAPEANGQAQSRFADATCLSAEDRAYIEAKEPVSERKSLRWVYHSVGLDVKPVEAPNTGAWSYLQWIRSSPQAKSEFYTKVCPKIMANSDDHSDDFSDDGGPVTSMINRLLEAYGEKASEAKQPEDAANGR